MRPNTETIGVVFEPDDLLAVALAHEIARSFVNMEHIPQPLQGRELRLPVDVATGTVAADQLLAMQIRETARLAGGVAARACARSRNECRALVDAGVEGDLLQIAGGELRSEQDRLVLFDGLMTDIDRCVEESAQQLTTHTALVA